MSAVECRPSLGNAAKPVRIHEQAAAEYEHATDWYLARSELAAVRFVAEVEHAVEAISAAPRRWPLYAHGTRRILFRRFPFAIIYRELPAVIQVLAIAHGRRRPGYWKDRLK